jgi:DNA-binding GntR family transcriptional regulator
MTMSNMELQEASPSIIMDDFFKSVQSAIVNAQSAAAELDTRRDELAAEEACLACRDAVQRFFLARGDFGAEINQTAGPLIAALRSTRVSLQELFNTTHSETIQHYLQNIEFRERIMEALIGDDPSAVKRLLKQELATIS